MTRRHQNTHTVAEIGYLDQQTAIATVEEEQNRSIIEGNCVPRLRELQEVTKFLNLYRPGNILRISLRKKAFVGTVLGFRRNKNRGWVIGILMKNTGEVKEITIDPKGYELWWRDDLAYIEVVEDRKSQYIALVTKNELILTLSPAA